MAAMPIRSDAMENFLIIVFKAGSIWQVEKKC
jgi:hypothetical protein